MKTLSWLLLVAIVALTGCVNQCCTPYGYGYYYRPTYAYAAPVYATPVAVLPTVAYATPAYFTPSVSTWPVAPAYYTPMPANYLWHNCCTY